MKFSVGVQGAEFKASIGEETSVVQVVDNGVERLNVECGQVDIGDIASTLFAVGFTHLRLMHADAAEREQWLEIGMVRLRDLQDK